ncbi:hypothetical protein [Nonomuraea turcica]|uniref:hypothetical protein n=1 Tax=Nonomuraea sp. G32 TaxID=3067274 RepID=UPI00273C6D1B|nr:hypothetical protein [Nonomuraea sp. G32]MDP4510479.1 hypothetical protein [Nonomuraea sp. G32]
MAQLDITNLHCFKTRDGITNLDEIDVYLALDGGSEEHVSGPHHLNKSRNNETVSLAIHKEFSTRAVVRLRERNGGRGGENDLDLGTEEFGPAVQAARDISFSGNNGRVVYTAQIGVSA